MALLGHRRARQAADRADGAPQLGLAAALLLGARPVVVHPQPRPRHGRMGDAPACVDPAPVLVHGLAVAMDEAVGRQEAHHSGRVDHALVLHLVIGSQRPALEIALDHQPFRFCLMPGGAEIRPADDHAGELVVLLQHLGQGRARGREEELVHVQEGDPARVLSMSPAAVLEGGEDGPRAPVVPEERVRPPVHDHDALGDVGGEHLLVIVRAAVVVQEEPLDPHQPVELDPLRAGTRHHRGRSCRRRGRLRCARRTIPCHILWNRSTSSPRPSWSEALGRPEVIPVCSGDGEFVVTGDGSSGRPTPRASRSATPSRPRPAAGRPSSRPAARVSARDRVAVEARDGVRVRMIGNGSVLALDRRPRDRERPHGRRSRRTRRP